MALTLKTPEEFAHCIERKMIENTCGYLEAIVIYCEEEGMEISVVPKLISRALKQKIEREASSLNLINRGKKYARLPLD